MDAHIPGQKVGYARVSSVGQRLDRQVVAIGEVDRLFTDEVSGRSRSDRHGLNAALSWVRAGDELRVASMDRLARSLVDLESLVDELVQRGVIVSFMKEKMMFTTDTMDPFATFQRQLIGAVAELERSLIRERQREGIELAKVRGVYQGRARRLTPEQIADAQTQVKAGVPKAAIARRLGCSRRTVYAAIQGEGAYGGTPTEES